MSTKLLAQQLGLIEVIPVDKYVQKHNIQTFDYLVVLDFEATCWNKNDPQKGLPEIIEFPAVLYSIKQNKILQEFQQYVMPTEKPKLSIFCTELTGITQDKVDEGVPLQTSLMLFLKWIRDLTNNYDLTFESRCLNFKKKKCALVTWSDWDLGTCLQNECKRKRISKPDLFNKWIDLRALYKEHYNRRPKGLSGALSEVGLIFDGKEHCGLDDAKNTASLARKIISEGVLLRITKDLNVDYL